MLLQRSQYLVVHKLSGSYLIYHSLFGNPWLVDKATLDFLEYFKTPSLARSFVCDKSQPILGVLRRFVRDRFLNIPGYEERTILRDTRSKWCAQVRQQPQLDALTLLVTSACNFRCTYCYQSRLPSAGAALWREGVPHMTFPAAARACEILTASARKSSTSSLRIGFNGGEPLMNWVLIENVLHHVRESYGDEFTVRWGINTNCARVTSAIADTLRRFDVHVSTSLDGTQLANNKVRRTANDRGTFHLICQGIRSLLNAGVKVDGIYCVLARENVGSLDINFLDVVRDLGVHTLVLEPDFSREYLSPPAALADRVFEFFQEGTRRGVRVMGSWTRPLRNLFEGHHRKWTPFYCLGVSGRTATVAPSGQLMACAGFRPFRTSIWRADPVRQLACELASVGMRCFAGTIRHCKGCPIEGFCKGGCHLVDQAASTVGQSQIRSQRCEFLLAMTRRLLEDLLRDQAVRLQENECAPGTCRVMNTNREED